MKQNQFNALNIYQNIEPDSTFDFIQKGKKAIIGSIHQWSNGKSYRKVLDGWVEVKDSFRLDLNKTTEEQFCINGVWNEKRVEKVHKPIIEDFLNKVDLKSKTPIVTLMMGAPASGKGLVVRHLKSTEEEYKNLPVLNPDHIKTEGLKDDYEKYQNHGVELAANNVHNEGSYITKEIAKKLNKIGAHYIYDRTFSNYDKLINEINTLGKLGVKVKIMMVTLPMEIAYQRMIERGKRTGRYVLIQAFEKCHTEIEDTYKKLVNNIPSNVVLIRRYNTEKELRLLKEIRNEKTQ